MLKEKPLIGTSRSVSELESLSKVYPAKGVTFFEDSRGFEMKTIILGALALCLAAPAVASADQSIYPHPDPPTPSSSLLEQ